MKLVRSPLARDQFRSHNQARVIRGWLDNNPPKRGRNVAQLERPMVNWTSSAC